MEINNLQTNEFYDMFNMSPTQTKDDASFARGSDVDTNLFNDDRTLEEIEADKLAADLLKSKPDNQSDEESKEELDADGNPIAKDDDIFMHDEDKAKLGRKPKYDFSDTAGYLEDRIKNGKFVKIEEEDGKGESKTFIPKTPEEFDEFFELQISHKLEEKTKEVTENWYKQLSPAWQTVAKYSEMVAHPKDLIPYIQGVQNIDDISSIDEKNVEGAEQIVRFRMNLAGDPEEAITEQIDALKETNKLISTAERFKPLLLQYEQSNLATLNKQRQLEESRQIEMINSNRDKAIEKIEAPFFGKQKLKDDEKAVVFDMIAIPDQQLGGYAIYNEIDKLYETQDFETLTNIALLLKKKDSFLGYLSKISDNKVAESLQKKLKVSLSTTSSGEGEGGQQQQNRGPVITRTNGNTGGFTRRR